MSKAIAKELDNRNHGDRTRCVICNPRAKIIREDQLWAQCPTNGKHSHEKEER